METKRFQIYGMDWPIFVFFAAVVLVAAWFNIIPNQLIGGIAVMFTLGIIFGEIGERIPIWNKYLGGGAILAFLGCGLLVYMDWMPKNILQVSKGWMSTYNFLNTFICFLIVGSLLGIERKVLLKSSLLYMPALLASLAGAAVLGVAGGMFFGKNPATILTAYVLPIMGGGAGAGAIPMAQVYHDVTGQDSSSYLSFCMAILAVGNLVAVAFAIILDNVGKLFPRLTGHGELMRQKKAALEAEKEKEETLKRELTMGDIGAAIFLSGGFFVLATLVSKKILPTIFGVAIPNFAYLIIFATMANVLNLIPERTKEACHRVQQFCASKLVWVQMAGCGITLIDVKQMMSVLSPENFLLVVLIVLGCVVGSGLFGLLVGFYPVESAITAGLCMANMGGAGDLAVLGAAKRMELMSYAQISSRIGGAIVLLVGSFIFQFL